MPKTIEKGTVTALKNFNSDYNKSWTWGENWSNVGDKDFETFINNYLFPKLNETSLINVDLGNRFNWLAKEVDFVSQFSEEYVIMDSVPVSMNLSKNEENMLKRNYPKMATRLYGSGILRKQKFTLNNNDVRLNWLTLADGVQYAVGVYKKKISDINVLEEKELKAMIVDYSITQTNEVRNVGSLNDLSSKIMTALLNLQNNSTKYNETNKASGGSIGQYTTTTKIDKVVILTNDTVKAFLLDTKIANTFQIAGLDITDKIISFDDLGGVWKVIAEEIEITETDTIDFFKSMGDYQIEKGDKIFKDEVITFDVSNLKEFIGKVEEVKPPTELFASIFDIDKIRYRVNTKDMLKEPFYNGEYDEITYWIHYYSFKAISPFFNNIVLMEKEENE